MLNERVVEEISNLNKTSFLTKHRRLIVNVNNISVSIEVLKNIYDYTSGFKPTRLTYGHIMKQSGSMSVYRSQSPIKTYLKLNLL
jgi:hypothetical protein